MKTYYSVGVGRNTDMQYHAAPDITCGHKHRTYEAADKCRAKLIGMHRDSVGGGMICSAKWYNAYIVASAPENNSGWNKVG